ncbi:LexA family transcriptional regulator [Enterobacter asburiae]|uniref:helix-turn-helix domain-containing protein n=1 Tax=Enterobacter asburiae TaxID=61645 RepID=UPI003B258F1F
MKKIKIKSGFWERVSKARALNSLTQKELAELVGVSQRQIAAYENVESEPRERTLMKLAEALGTTPEWLASGEGESRIKARISPADTARKIPIIDLEDVFYHLMTPERERSGLKYHPTALELSDLAFALIMTDESMQPLFPLGSVVIFEPCIYAKGGDFVVAAQLDKPSIFRQLLTGVDSAILSPLDTRYPTDTFEKKNTALIPAVAVETYLPARERMWDRDGYETFLGIGRESFQTK